MIDFEKVIWKEFVIGKIFTVYSTSSSIDKNKLLNLEGTNPYVTRTDQNNGYDLFIGIQDDKFIMDKGNVITIGLDTQTVFYQKSKFYTGQNIQILEFDELNEYNAKFVVTLLRTQMTKFNWGGNGATLTRLKKTKILLPATPEHKPDFKFMEVYVREKEEAMTKRYKKYISSQIEVLKLNLLNLNIKIQWKEFFIEDVFNVKSGKRLIKADMVKGDIPFVGATESGNGITEFISNKNSSLDKNILGVNYNGSVVENFYHPYEAIFSDDVKRLSFANTTSNKYKFLFCKSAILKQKVKYEYGYKFNGERMKRQKIILPVNEKGLVDYDYMEQYMKALEYQKITNYLDFKELKKDADIINIVTNKPTKLHTRKNKEGK